MRCQEIFQSFYLANHNGRRLLWQSSLGRCTLKARFAGGPRELIVSQFQAVVLLCFNDCAEFTYAQLKERTEMEDAELERTLLSMCMSKQRLLLKQPTGKTVTPTDRFQVNDRFTHALRRIRIKSIQDTSTPEERTQTEEQVFADRQFQVDAAIVRIMKARQQLTHSKLLVEVFALCKFPMESADVKKRIESLLARDYLERVEGEDGVPAYRYVA